MHLKSTSSELFIINEMESKIIDILDDIERETIRTKLNDIFKNDLSQSETENKLRDIESDIRLCREICSRIVDYCDKRRTDFCKGSSTKWPFL